MNNVVPFLSRGLFFALLFSFTFRGIAGDVNKTDHSGQRQGYWIITAEMTTDKSYQPGERVEEGVYKDNRKEGVWKKYWPGGRLRSEITYHSGRPHGAYVLYYPNGFTEESGNWINNRNTGEYRRYYPNGYTHQQFVFNEEGRRNGWQKYYYENGRLAMEVEVNNGQENGTCRRYHTNGNLSEETAFTKGVVNKGSTKRYPGTPRSPEVATDPYDASIGKPAEPTKDKTNAASPFKADGFNTLYDKNGHITQVGDFRNGRLFNGKWYRYNTDGLLLHIEIYRNGRCIGHGVISDQDL